MQRGRRTRRFRPAPERGRRELGERDRDRRRSERPRQAEADRRLAEPPDVGQLRRTGRREDCGQQQPQPEHEGAGIHFASVLTTRTVFPAAVTSTWAPRVPWLSNVAQLKAWK